MAGTSAGAGSASDNLVGLVDLAGVVGIPGAQVRHGRAGAGDVQFLHRCTECLYRLLVLG